MAGDFSQHKMMVADKAFHRQSGDHRSSLCDGCVDTIQRCIHYAQQITGPSFGIYPAHTGFLKSDYTLRPVVERNCVCGTEIAFCTNATK